MRRSTILIAVSFLTLASVCLASEIEDTTLWGELRHADAVAVITIEDVRLPTRTAEAADGGSQPASDPDSCAPALIVGRVQRVVYQRDPQQVMPAGLIWNDGWCSHFGAWPRSAIVTFGRTDAGWDQEPLALDLGDELTTNRLAFHVERARSLLAASPVNPRKLAEWALQIAYEEDDRLRNIGIQLLAYAQLPVAIGTANDPKPALRLSDFVLPREIDTLIEPVTYDDTDIGEWAVLLEAFARERAPALYEEIANGLTEELEDEPSEDPELQTAMEVFLRMGLRDQAASFGSLRQIYRSDHSQLRHIWADASRQQLVPGDPVPLEWWHPELMPETPTQNMVECEVLVVLDRPTERLPPDEPEDEPDTDDSGE